MDGKTSDKLNEIRVLHIKEQLSADGATVIILNLARQLQGKVTFDWLLFEEGDRHWHEMFETLGSTIHVLNSFKGGPKLRKWFKTYLTAKKFFKTHPYHTIHIDTNGFAWVPVLLAAKTAGIEQRIVHSHSANAEGSSISGKPFLQKIGRTLYMLLATDCIACSKEAGQWLFGSNAQGKVQLLKNGIDTKRFRFDAVKRAACRDELGIKDELVVGHVGRFVKVKNHAFLLTVFQKIHEKIPRSRLLLIGTGELKQEISRRIEESGFQDAVTMIDETDCPERYYCAMDVFVLPSLSEGLGLVAVEAQCSGLPSFISANCPEEAVITNSCFRLPLEMGAEAWCERILDESKNTHTREEAYLSVRKHGYDIGRTAEQFYALYQRPYRS